MITVFVNDHSKTFLNISKISKNFKIFKFAPFTETVRDRAKRSEFPTLAGLSTAYKITNFVIFNLLVSDWIINIFHYLSCKEYEFRFFQIYLIKILFRDPSTEIFDCYVT